MAFTHSRKAGETSARSGWAHSVVSN